MKRHWLVIVTSLTVLLTVYLLARAGWSSSHRGRSSLSHALKSRDPLASPSAWRWRQGLPNHWRACLLQR